MMHSKAITYQSVDESLDCAYWEQIWAQDWDAREQMYVGQAHLDYWQARAEDFSDGRKACDFDFGRKILQILEPLLPAKARILDVGCGPGSLLIPFCQAGLEVTAVEPAREMIKQLNANAFSEGVHNYSVQAKPWQEVDLDLLAKSFDLAISAITMWMFRDLRNQLERLEKHPKTCAAW